MNITPKLDGKVTVVIASYLRADALKVTLNSLYKQTFTDWQAIIISDRCPAEHFEALQPLDDRVRYINLPVRCGQQYGPNSVGIHLCDTEFIAFLNHDDIWLEDHLELAVKTLKTTQKEIFMGRAAFCHPDNQPRAPERLLFSEVNRPEELWCSLQGPNSFFEPASSWVISSSLAKKVGYWLPPDQVLITPVMNWVSRLASDETRFTFSKEVSVLKFNLHHDSKHSNTAEYTQPSSGLSRIQRYIDNPATQTRMEVAHDMASANEKGLLVRENMGGKELVMTEVMDKQKEHYYKFKNASSIVKKLDFIYGKLFRKSGAEFAQKTIKRRTGEEITKFPIAQDIIKELYKNHVI